MLILPRMRQLSRTREWLLWIEILSHGNVAWENCLGRLKSLWKKEEACSRDDHSRRRSRIGCMKQSDTERPSRDPSRVGGIKFGEDVFGVVAAVFRNGKDGYDNGKHTSKGPENSKRLFLVSNTYGSLSKGVSHQAMAASGCLGQIPGCTEA